MYSIVHHGVDPWAAPIK